MVRARLSIVVELVLAAAACLLLLPVAASAAPGGLDPTFGNGGIALTSLGSGLDKATAMAAEPDGSYIVAGIHTDATTSAQTCTIVHFLHDGSIDSAFGSSWGAGLHAPAVAQDWDITQILVDGQGRIYLCSDYEILRLLSDGQVDTSFGDNGVVDAKAAVGNPGTAVYAPCMALFPGGGLVVGGGAYDAVHNNDIAVLRLNDDGSIDNTFGNAGLFRIDVANGSFDTFTGIAVAAGGDILVSGMVQTNTLLLRLTPTGALDSSFGDGGLVLLGLGGRDSLPIFEQSDGSIVVGFFNKLERVSAAGTLDTSYGTDGVLTLTNAANFQSNVLLVQSDGSIVRVGTIDDGYPTYQDIYVTRNLADGSVDAGFGTNGQVVTDLGGADDCAAAALDPSGDLVVAGYAYPTGTASSSMWAASTVLASPIFGMGLIRYECGPSLAATPSITSLSPTAGRVGTTVTLSGSGFTGATRVTFHGVVAKFTVVSGTRITATVPAAATSGKISVTTPGGRATSTAKFTVKPKIRGLSRTSGRRGVTVVLTGYTFGSRRGTSVVKFGTVRCTKYLSWSKTRIKCRVPARARLGRTKIRVKTGAGVSNAKSFRVRR